jgi:hypothetical protein
LWWTKKDQTPPLVTTGPIESLGVLDQSGTTVLFGGDIDHHERNGGRFAIGMWLDDGQTLGVEGNYFFLGRDSVDFSAASSGGPDAVLLARPFFNILGNTQDVQLTAFPNIAAGRIDISHSSQLQGAEANAICRLCGDDGCGCDSGYRVDLVGGFRYLRLNEDLTLDEHARFLERGLAEAFGFQSAAVTDQFGTDNHFYGGQLGVRAEWRRGRVWVNARGTVALGGTDQHVRINGATALTRPNGTTDTLPGGLLALQSNIGNYRRDEFSVVPEIGLNVGYRVSGHLRAFVGYTFLYWTQVVRPGEQLDVSLNTTQIPTSRTFGPLAGPARPAFLFKDSDFWAQGLNFGLEFRF